MVGAITRLAIEDITREVQEARDIKEATTSAAPDTDITEITKAKVVNANSSQSG